MPIVFPHNGVYDLGHRDDSGEIVDIHNIISRYIIIILYDNVLF